MIKNFVLWAALCGVPAALKAQMDFTVEGRELQVHGFASQGVAYSNVNNFLTMATSHGSFALTDFGLNLSAQLTDHLRVGAQVYDRNIGQLGGWIPMLDYGYVDYRFKDWLGVRGGRVKTQLGLYTSTQDADFLRTWALLPQGIYPTDLRSTNIAHDGIDLYGDVALRHSGSLHYTAYAGHRPDDPRSGQYLQYEDYGLTGNKISAKMAGVDLRWATPVNGLTVGVSECFLSEHISSWRFGQPLPAVAGPYRETDVYGEYVRGRLTLAAEYRNNTRILDFKDLGQRFQRNLSEVPWFVSVAFRINRFLELGAYHSHYVMNHIDSFDPAEGSSIPHIYDEVATVRIDLAKSLNFKIEGHFMDGTGYLLSPHGFYIRDNAHFMGVYGPVSAMRHDTNMLVARLGWNF